MLLLRAALLLCVAMALSGTLLSCQTLTMPFTKGEEVQIGGGPTPDTDLPRMLYAYWLAQGKGKAPSPPLLKLEDCPHNSWLAGRKVGEEMCLLAPPHPHTALPPS